MAKKCNIHELKTCSERTIVNKNWFFFYHQGDQQSARSEDCRRDINIFIKTNWEHRAYSRDVFHHLWYSWRTGKYLKRTILTIGVASAVSLVLVVRKVDNVIQRINQCSEDSVVCFVNIYSLNCELSSG